MEKDAILKANSKTWGLGGLGGACGAIQGPIHFLGYLYGENLTVKEFDPSEIMRVLNKLNVIPEFTLKMKEHWGSTECGEIHNQIMGRSYDLNNLSDIGAFINDGARNKCQVPVEYAIRITCDLILDDDGRIIF